MPHTSNPDQLCHILLVSEDETKEKLLSERLDRAGEGCFKIKRYTKLEALKSLELETFCDVALVDLELGADRLIPFLHWIGNLHSPVPLVAACRDFADLQPFENVRFYIDDYLLIDDAGPEELATRIDQVLRQREKIHYLYQEQNLLH